MSVDSLRWSHEGDVSRPRWALQLTHDDVPFAPSEYNGTPRSHWLWVLIWVVQPVCWSNPVEDIDNNDLWNSWIIMLFPISAYCKGRHFTWCRLLPSIFRSHCQISCFDLEHTNASGGLEIYTVQPSHYFLQCRSFYHSSDRSEKE
jgi:hypothetical protein